MQTTKTQTRLIRVATAACASLILLSSALASPALSANGEGRSVRGAGASGGAAAGAKGGVQPQSSGCAVTFTNPGPPALTACVSSHGNINNLLYNPSGAPVDQVAREGYCLVDLNAPSTVYWDSGDLGEAGWDVATQSSTATTTTVTRTTTDGIYTLTQNIFFKYGSRLVLVGNLLTNNDTIPHHVRFNRYAHLVLDGFNGDKWDVAGTSVFAKQTNGVALTSLGNPALVQASGAETFNNWNATGKSSCGHTLVAMPSTGNDVAIMQHDTTIPSGATVNFRVGYRLL
jgi:hypothetical protein